MRHRLVTLLTLLTILLSLTSASSQDRAANLLLQESQNLLDNSSLPEIESKSFKKSFLTNPDWQHEFFDSGSIKDPAASVRLLYELWQLDPSLANSPIDRQMATACALQGPVKNADIKTMGPRYEYFRNHWKEGLLNVRYGDLTVFERRYLADGVQHKSFNNIDAMEYCLQEMSLPAEDYAGACWYARWIDHNPFGDSVQGPKYYAPYHKCWDNHSEMVRNVGGVCGSLSNLGAAAAIANGIPAATMGEPGHCAHTIMLKPHEWSLVYSLSWNRDLHCHFGQNTWSFHILTEKSLHDTALARRTGDLRRLAQSQLDAGSQQAALATLRTSLSNNPYDYPTWLLRARFIKPEQNQEWKKFAQDALTSLAKEFPETAWRLLADHALPHLLPQGSDPANTAERARILLSFHQALQGWGQTRWNLEGALNEQLALLSEDPAAADDFIVQVFATHAEHGEVIPAILDFEFNLCKDDNARRSAFIKGISQVLSKGQTGKDFAQTIQSLAARLLPDAAARSDKSTFQSIGKLAAANYEPCPIKPITFPGILLSSGGTFAISDPRNRWDSPAKHWGVIEDHGGYFHTNSAPATATVQLGNYGRLSGVVIVQRESNRERIQGAKLQASADGSNWTDLATINETDIEIRIDLREHKFDASHVRVFHPTEPYIHFHKFLVYGSKQN